MGACHVIATVGCHVTPYCYYWSLPRRHASPTVTGRYVTANFATGQHTLNITSVRRHTAWLRRFFFFQRLIRRASFHVISPERLHVTTSAAFSLVMPSRHVSMLASRMLVTRHFFAAIHANVVSVINTPRHAAFLHILVTIRRRYQWLNATRPPRPGHWGHHRMLIATVIIGHRASQCLAVITPLPLPGTE